MKEKIQNLRNLLSSYALDGYLIQTADEYQNEYVPASSKRLEYITGFTGSNGYTIITKDKAYFFTDSRYLLQATKELPDYYEIQEQRADFELEGAKIGFNPALLTQRQIDMLYSKLKLAAIEEDLVDKIWQDKPDKPATEAYLYGIKYTGASAVEKLALVRKNMSSDYLFITNPTNVCWLLNIRASDIPYCPVMLSRMLISKDKALLFTNLNRISSDIKDALGFIEFCSEEMLESALSNIGDKVAFDSASCSIALEGLLKNKTPVLNPILLHQVRKNIPEINNSIEVHIKDAVALIEALSSICDLHKSGAKMTEYEAGLILTKFREKQEGYVVDSFPAIVGFRSNGAIVHYRASQEGAALIKGDGVLLIDSGAHYLGGTTDVTRNLAFGSVSSEIKRKYTAVLKGHINIALQKFTAKTPGSSLDILARMYLWRDSVDYGHGTGHGVGNFLSVHEGSGISPMATQSLPEGMICSNEPGYYKEGEYGIRVENLIYVKNCGDGFLRFENLTLVPYCRALIDFSYINKEEMEYLTQYYARIKETIRPHLSANAKEWLDGEMVIYS